MQVRGSICVSVIIVGPGGPDGFNAPCAATRDVDIAAKNRINATQIVNGHCANFRKNPNDDGEKSVQLRFMRR
jgi:hypothetical protein